MRAEARLRRQLGLAAVAAVVMGDMLGSGIFFTPGELASVARSPWQVYFFWGLCGVITFCGALTLAELTALLPRAGATYHIIREGFGPFWGFLRAWVEMCVSGPGSVAGVAVVFGEFTARLFGSSLSLPATAWGAAAILMFTVINLLGIQWGGRTQIALTAIKITGLLALIAGSLILADRVAPSAAQSAAAESAGLADFIRLVGLGVAAVLFTYDGWVDVSHVAGEVEEPRRNLPLGLGLGVAAITLLYLIVNHAYLRVVPLETMREAPTTIAASVALVTFGPKGGQVLNGLIMLSILGALGGLVMTIPRLYYAVAAQYAGETAGSGISRLFRTLAWVSPQRAVPAASILFTAALSIAALVFFGTFRRIVTYFVVPLHVSNILVVASVFRLRRRSFGEDPRYLAPGYPVLPAVYILVISLFLVSAIFYNPLDTFIGIAMTATGIPVYLWIARSGRR